MIAFSRWEARRPQFVQPIHAGRGDPPRKTRVREAHKFGNALDEELFFQPSIPSIFKALGIAASFYEFLLCSIL